MRIDSILDTSCIDLTAGRFFNQSSVFAEGALITRWKPLYLAVDSLQLLTDGYEVSGGKVKGGSAKLWIRLHSTVAQLHIMSNV